MHKTVNDGIITVWWRKGLRPKSTFDLLDKFGPSRERSLKQASDQSTYSYRMTWFQRGSHIAWCQREKGAPRSVNSCRRHHLRHTTPTCFILKIDRPWHQLTHHDIRHSSSPPRRWKKIGTWRLRNYGVQCYQYTPIRSPHHNYVTFRGVVGSTARGANGALRGAASAPQAMRGGVPSYESRGSDVFIQECMMLGVINLHTSR